MTNYKNLVEKAFKYLRNENVFVPERPNTDEVESWGENCLTVFNNEEAYKGEYSPEYVIFQEENGNEWYFAINTQTYGGSWLQPPEWDMVESKEGYKSVIDALNGLFISLLNESFQDICISWQMES